MTRLRRYFRNWAETDEPGDRKLSDIVLPLSPVEAIRQVEAVARGLPRWNVEKVDVEGRRLHLTHLTGLWRFVDDIHLTFETAEGGTRVRGRSQSRVGLLDFGQNRRNLKELIAALRQT
jgi:uncharacterized protein (DUF1499 family)